MMETRPYALSLKAIGDRLRLTREAFGLNQTEFAGRCGIAHNTYNQYEKGRNLPRLDIAARLCEEYGITLDWIYRGNPSGLPYNVATLIRQREAATQPLAKE